MASGALQLAMRALALIVGRRLVRSHINSSVMTPLDSTRLFSRRRCRRRRHRCRRSSAGVARARAAAVCQEREEKNAAMKGAKQQKNELQAIRRLAIRRALDDDERPSARARASYAPCRRSSPETATSRRRNARATEKNCGGNAASGGSRLTSRRLAVERRPIASAKVRGATRGHINERQVAALRRRRRKIARCSFTRARLVSKFFKFLIPSCKRARARFETARALVGVRRVCKQVDGSRLRASS